MDSLLSTFTTYLIAPQEMPLHEAYYFDQVGSLRKHLSPAPRAALQTALSNPGYYLSGMGQEGAGLSSDMPDLCIMYQLHLECGKLINLYDWLQVVELYTIFIQFPSYYVNFTVFYFSCGTLCCHGY